MEKIKFVYSNAIQVIDFGNSEFTPNTTLLQYIRSFDDSKGTKEGCNEGDCGACTVVLVELKDGKLKFRAVNSCVFFLASVHGKQVITIEDLGKYDNLNPLQNIFVENHASQCGFCTPGFIMSAFAQKAENIKSQKAEIIEAFTGNLCRCTGYQSIVKSAEAIEKIDNSSFFLPLARPDLLNQIFSDEPVTINSDGFTYIIPQTFSQALEFRRLYPHFTVTAGGSDLVLKVTKRKEPVHNIIDISQVRDIKFIKETENEFLIGAGAKIEDFYQLSKTKIPQIAEYLSFFGAKQIRNRATLGGNLGTASPIGDILPLLFALDAIIEVQGISIRKINVSEFIKGYRKTDLSENELIKTIIIPKPEKNSLIKAYKISKRTNLDISTVSACFNFKIENNIIKNAKIAFGGMAEKPVFAFEAQNFLINKEFNEDNFIKAAEIVKSEFNPITDARSSADSRKIFAKNLLIKFYEDVKQNF